MEFGIKQLGDLSGLAWEVAQICLVIAVLVVVVVELLKALFKPVFQRLVLRIWLNRLDRFLQIDIDILLIHPDGGDDYPHLNSIAQRRKEGARNELDPRLPVLGVNWTFLFPPYVFRLPGQLFMQLIEAQAKRILANPAKYPDALFLLASGAAARDRELAVLIDEQSGEMTSDQQIAIGRVSAEIDNQLDSLQLEVTQRWQSTVRRMAVGSGMVLAVVLGATTAGPAGTQDPSFWTFARFALTMLAIGVLSGFAATVLYDLLTRLTRARGETY